MVQTPALRRRVADEAYDKLKETGDWDAAKQAVRDLLRTETRPGEDCVRRPRLERPGHPGAGRASLARLKEVTGLRWHDAWSRWGWPCYLLANLAMLGFAVPAGAWGLAAQQIAFTATSLLGLRRAFRAAPRRRCVDAPPAP